MAIDESVLQSENNDDIYKIIKVNKENILDELGYEENKRDIAKDIISNLEKTIIEAIKVRNVAMIPYVGCIRYQPIQMALKPHYDDMRKFRKVFGKEMYKQELKSVCKTLYLRKRIMDSFTYEQTIKKENAELLNKYQRGWQHLYIHFRKFLIPVKTIET